MRIRRATKEDSQTVSNLNRVVQRIHADAHPEIFKPTSEEVLSPGHVERWLADPNKIVYLVEEAGEPIGYLFMEIMERPETPFGYYRRYIHIHGLSVNPGYRRKGYGTRLIEKAEEVAREMAIDKVTLSVWHFNEPARRFYSSQGFLPYNIRMWKEIT